jgi:hypothetical protein
MLTNVDITEIAQHYGFQLSGVYMKDELSHIKPQAGNYVINLQSSTEGNGTHWVAMIIQGKNCFYSDSFGITPPIEVIQFCKRFKGSHLAFSEMESQHLNASTCGWYACGLLIYISHNPQKEFYKACGEYINQFSYDTIQNNTILKSYFRRLPESRGFKNINILYRDK